MARNRPKGGSKFGKGMGKGWARDRGQKGKMITAKLESDKRIIKNTPALDQFYLRTIQTLSTGWETHPLAIQQIAIKLTKDFAEQQGIPWGL